MSNNRTERRRKSHHLLNLHFYKLERPFQFCHFDAPCLTLWTLGLLRRFGGSHRRGDVDEEHRDGVLEYNTSITRVCACIREEVLHRLVLRAWWMRVRRKGTHRHTNTSRQLIHVIRVTLTIRYNEWLLIQGIVNVATHTLLRFLWDCFKMVSATGL